MKRNAWWALLGAAVLVSGLLVYRHAFRPAPAEPDTSMTALVGRLQDQLPGLYVIAARADADLADGAYLCDGPRNWPELSLLRRNGRRDGSWKGVVHCEPVNESCIADCDDWGVNGLQRGPFVFYGDPEMIDRISALP